MRRILPGFELKSSGDLTLMNIHVNIYLNYNEPDDGLICGFCPLAMPSAASQLISLDLFSNGQRDGFDLASPCNGFLCFVGRF